MVVLKTGMVLEVGPHSHNGCIVVWVMVKIKLNRESAGLVEIHPGIDNAVRSSYS